MAGRSHNVAAQATTLGKRFASAAEEMLVALTRLRELIDRYPLRGIKGPMGTAQDMLDLFGGDAARAGASWSGGWPSIPRVSPRCSTSVGQVYPRSLDHDVVSALVQLGAGPSSLAHTIRLMAGHELVTEGFAPGQVGSSAMPHKMNTRSCERVNGLQVVLRGYASMAGGTGRGAMERGRRVLLGGAPGGAARRVLRHRRADRDVPDRARRVRRLSRR